MANLKASKKDIIKSRKNRAQNVQHKTKMRTSIKKALSAITGKQEQKEVITKEALRIIDKTAAKGVIHKRTAARTKSRLMLAANKAKI